MKHALKYPALYTQKHTAFSPPLSHTIARRSVTKSLPPLLNDGGKALIIFLKGKGVAALHLFLDGWGRETAPYSLVMVRRSDISFFLSFTMDVYIVLTM